LPRSLGDQFLDHLGPGRLVLDQHDTGVVEALLVAARAFEGRVFEPAAQQAEQVEVFGLIPQVVRTL
jgi:hypothetical protein